MATKIPQQFTVAVKWHLGEGSAFQTAFCLKEFFHKPALEAKSGA